MVAVDGCGDGSSSGLAHWSVVGFVVADVAQVANSVIISLFNSTSTQLIDCVFYKYTVD